METKVFSSRKTIKKERIYLNENIGCLWKKNNPEKVKLYHIIPLQGKMISGLHIHNNLQIITRNKNRSKGNKYETT